ncbi:putative Zinc finger, MYND-type, peptidase C19, ubiquitin-specific peptidase, DUSP [Plasmopara halstedii]
MTSATALDGIPSSSSETSTVTVSSQVRGIFDFDLGENSLHSSGNKLLDRSKQCEIVKRLMAQADQQGLQVGDKRFLLSAKWWEHWCEFVGYGDKSFVPVSVDIPAPGHINNLPLLNVGSDTALDELMGGPLRPHLKENYHYVLIPLEVWDALTVWYGGGPTIARFVVQVGDPKLGNTFNRVQVFPEQGVDKASEISTNDSSDKPMRDECKTVKFAASGMKEDNLNIVAKKPVRQKVDGVAGSISKMCGACRKHTGTFKRCGGCRLIWYCNSNCQMSHWKYHKIVCRSTVTAEEKEDDILQCLQAERRGKMGLRNLGNTCFMNSALQCLSHVEILTRYFLSNKYKKDLNPDNPLGTGGNLAAEYDALLKDLWFGTVPCTSPANLKRAISRFAPQFSGFQQHDAQELLAYIIDGLHEDLNRVKHKPYTEVNESDGSQDDAAVAKEAWKRHLLRNDSIFVDHIQGQFKSTVVCPTCNKISITFDPFNCIQLELPQRQTLAIEVIFVPSDAGKCMTRYLLEVPKKGSVLVLKCALSKLCGVSPSSLLVADIYQSITYRTIRDTERLSRLREDDRILMYQIAHESADESAFYGFLYHKVGPTLTGDPLLFTYTASTTCAEMLEKWSLLLSTHISQASCAKIPANILSQCIYLTNRDGVILRNEPLPPATDAKFIDFATSHDEELSEDLVFVAVSWTSSMLLSSASPRPDIERIVNHESMRAKSNVSHHDGISLYDCFRNFVKPETLDQANLWYCSKCQEHRQARKTMEMWRLPDVMVLSLKRFEYRNEILRDKLDVYVDFPLEGLDMSPFCLEKSDDKDHLCYDLFAVSNHYGGMGFGHYTAFAKSWNDGVGEMYPGWYSFDDSQVTPAMIDQIKSNAAYILFYKRKSLQVGAT